MANVNFMTLAVWRLFRCQAYDKKVRWTFRLPVLEQPKVHYAQKNRNDV